MADIPPMDNRYSNKYEENPAWKCDHHQSGLGVRNLIVCIDGTANQFGKKNTNVIELYNLILKEEEDKQLTWYNSGIGTYARPSWRSFKYFRKVIDHKIDLAIAWNFERTILAAYRWLSENYQKGDRIFLFGFSRGAFQVRVLAAMIDKVGLIRKGNEEQIPFAYELYADPESDKPSTEVTNVGSTAKQNGLPGKGKKTIAAWFKKIFSRKKPTVHADSRSDEPLPNITNVGSGTNQQRSPGPQETTMAARFKKAFSHNGVHVHYVGVWDTVSSIGIARGKYMLPGTVDGMKHVCYFRQALALDERRVKFAPEYAYGGSAAPTDNLHEKAALSTKSGPEYAAGLSSSPPEVTELPVSDQGPKAAPALSSPSPPERTNNPPEKRVSSMKHPKDDIPPHTLEVWFAGTHSDIGGGNAINEAMDRSRPPLRWMVFEAASAGLRTEPFQRVLPSNEQIEVEESLTGIWWLLEVLPINRLTYTRTQNGKKTTHKPNFGAHRKIHPGQKIHGSLILTNKHTNEYIPKARLPDNDVNLWLKLHTEGLGDWKAVDLFEGTQDLLNKFADQPDDSVWEHLRKTAILTADGQQAVYDAAIGTLRTRFTAQTASLAIKIQLMHNVMDILDSNRASGKLAKCDPDEVRAVFGDCKESKDNTYLSIARRFIMHYVKIQPNPDLQVEEFERFFISKLAVFPNNDRVILSHCATYHVWNSVTGATKGHPIEGKSGLILCLAVSPDAMVLLSGLNDGTISFQKDQGEMSMMSSGKGHTDCVRSVAFSPNSKWVVSGGDDGIVRLWDVARGSPVGEPYEASGCVLAVMFTHEGEHIMSLSTDQTVRVWDVATHSMVGEPLYLPGHLHGSIWCGAFSSDGKSVIVGTWKGEVVMWNLNDMQIHGKSCSHHEDWVSSVAFSPDNTKIASASHDGTVYISDTERQQVEYTLRHIDEVHDVSFFPDGKRVASACRDGEIGIWELEPSESGSIQESDL